MGCGNPTAVAELREGETVLDLGSGGGIDVLLSAKRVGATGKAYGLDMTDDMLALGIGRRDPGRDPTGDPPEHPRMGRMRRRCARRAGSDQGGTISTILG